MKNRFLCNKIHFCTFSLKIKNLNFSRKISCASLYLISIFLINNKSWAGKTTQCVKTSAVKLDLG